MAQTWDESRQAWVDGLGHQWNPSTQEWGPMQGTQAIQPYRAPAGTTAGGGSGVGQVSIGNQNRLDQAYIDNLAAGAKLGRDTLTQNASDSAASRALQSQQLTQNATRDAQQHEEFLANLGLSQQQLEQTFKIESARLGIEQATLNLNERQALANNALQIAGFNLSKEQFNAQQRQAQGAQMLDTLKMLADRNGPQDWTRYAYESAGEQAPNPDGTSIYDPLGQLAKMYQPSTVEAPAAMGAAPAGGTAPPLVSSVSGSTSASSASSAPGGAGWQTASPSAPSGAMVQQIGRPSPLLSNAAIANAAELPNRFRTGPIPTEAAPAPRLIGPSGFNAESTAAHEAALRIPYTGSDLPAYARGGKTGGMAIVGDSPSGKRTGHEEIAYAATNPETGAAELHVLPHHVVAQALDRWMGRHNGTVSGANKLPSHMYQSLISAPPRAATGGVFGAYDKQAAPTYNPLTNEQIQPVDPGQSMTQGASMAAPASTPMMGNAAGASHQPATAASPAAAPVWQGGPVSAPGTMVNQATQPAPSQAGQSPLVSNQAFDPNMPIGMQANAAAEGGWQTPAAQSLGPGQYDPYRIKVNHYSGDVMNNTPLLQMIRGQRPTYGFQGSSINPSIPSQGIFNLPTHLSAQLLARMQPNQLKMLQGIYDNPEAGTSWADILDQSQRAAPLVSGGRGAARAR